MRGKILSLLAAALLLPALSLVCAAQEPEQKRGASTAEERARAVELATKLENEPLAKDAKEIRGALLVFLAAVPDITISLCPSVLGNTKRMKGEMSSELVAQLLYSQARYVIEHPQDAQDDFKVYQAGVEGVLRTYKAARQAKPKLKFEMLEELLVRQEKGALGEYVKAQMDAGCRSNSSN